MTPVMARTMIHIIFSSSLLNFRFAQSISMNTQKTVAAIAIPTRLIQSNANPPRTKIGISASDAMYKKSWCMF